MRTWLTRANPLALLVVGVASVPASLAVRTLPIALVTVGLYAVLAFLLVPSWRYVLLCLAFALFAGLTVAYSTWRLGGRDEVVAATAGLRIVVLAWPGSLVAVLIDPARLGDHLGQNLRLPPRPVVAVTASPGRPSTLRYARRGGPPRPGPARGVHGFRAAGRIAALGIAALRGTRFSRIRRCGNAHLGGTGAVDEARRRRGGRRPDPCSCPGDDARARLNGYGGGDDPPVRDSASSGAHHCRAHVLPRR
ncbi:hypothetical protein [Aeromicrobium sp. CTD01-1L150]|uniref:hypothetical protein n=1 Tax=Aeromicrobium sp. CTD01-1L150 TaxID=3341830 RepID=UPI0035BF5065